MIYFIIADCEKTSLLDGRHVPITYYLEMFNDGSHFSEEEDGLLFFYIFATVIFLFILGTNIFNFIKDFKTYDKFETPHIFIMVAVTLDFGHVCFQLIHLWVYYYNGEGVPALDVISTI